MLVNGKPYHPNCFSCSTCHKAIGDDMTDGVCDDVDDVGDDGGNVDDEENLGEINSRE